MRGTLVPVSISGGTAGVWEVRQALDTFHVEPKSHKTLFEGSSLQGRKRNSSLASCRG